MIDRFLLKCFGAIDTLTEWLFPWKKPKCCCNVNTGSGNNCKRCGYKRK
jgi:hypothetical protein|tara:strand:+ start:1549 stop:1695 length:147 start_codon:yes stop_codon:yes gene_type:complete